MTKYLITCIVAWVFGYIGRIAVERFQRHQRERVLRALGGKLPDWEEQARALEARAHRAVNEMGELTGAARAAALLRSEADLTRRRGRRRDREWS